MRSGRSCRHGHATRRAAAAAASAAAAERQGPCPRATAPLPSGSWHRPRTRSVGRSSGCGCASPTASWSSAGTRVESAQPSSNVPATDARSRCARSPHWRACARADIVDAGLFEHDSGSAAALARAIVHGSSSTARTGASGSRSAVTRPIVTSPVNGSSRRSAPARSTSARTASACPAPQAGASRSIGRLFIGVNTPDAELRASAIDVGAARRDRRRGRAAGHRGAHARPRHRRRRDHLRRHGRDGSCGSWRSPIAASARRSTPPAPFAVRGARRVRPAARCRARPGTCSVLPRPDGRTSGLSPRRAGRVVIAATSDRWPRPPTRDRRPCGSRPGRRSVAEGRLVGLAGPGPASRRALPAGRLRGRSAASDGQPRRRIVPLADLERIG